MPELPAIPLVPNTERRTPHWVTATTTGPFQVGFPIWGPSTQPGIEVWIDGELVPNGWTLSSPSGALSLVPRPVTDAVITFNEALVGTVGMPLDLQIVGARQPSSVSQFGTTVPPRDQNKKDGDIWAAIRELFDRFRRVPQVSPGQAVPSVAEMMQISAAFAGAAAVSLQPSLFLSTKSAIALGNIPAVYQGVNTIGDTQPGIGGGPWKRVTSQPSHQIRVRSVDRFLPDGTTNSINGGWWSYAGRTITPGTAGALPGTLSTTQLQNCIDYLGTLGLGGDDLSSRYVTLDLQGATWITGPLTLTGATNRGIIITNGRLLADTSAIWHRTTGAGFPALALINLDGGATADVIITNTVEIDCALVCAGIIKSGAANRIRCYAQIVNHGIMGYGHISGSASVIRGVNAYQHNTNDYHNPCFDRRFGWGLLVADGDNLISQIITSGTRYPYAQGYDLVLDVEAPTPGSKVLTGLTWSCEAYLDGTTNTVIGDLVNRSCTFGDEATVITTDNTRSLYVGMEIRAGAGVDFDAQFVTIITDIDADGTHFTISNPTTASGSDVIWSFIHRFEKRFEDVHYSSGDSFFHIGETAQLLRLGQTVRNTHLSAGDARVVGIKPEANSKTLTYTNGQTTGISVSSAAMRGVCVGAIVEGDDFEDGTRITAVDGTGFTIDIDTPTTGADTDAVVDIHSTRVDIASVTGDARTFTASNNMPIRYGVDFAPLPGVEVSGTGIPAGARVSRLQGSHMFTITTVGGGVESPANTTASGSQIVLTFKMGNVVHPKMRIWADETGDVTPETQVDSIVSSTQIEMSANALAASGPQKMWFSSNGAACMLNSIHPWGGVSSAAAGLSNGQYDLTSLYISRASINCTLTNGYIDNGKIEQYTTDFTAAGNRWGRTGSIQKSVFAIYATKPDQEIESFQPGDWQAPPQVTETGSIDWYRFPSLPTAPRKANWTIGDWDPNTGGDRRRPKVSDGAHDFINLSQEYDPGVTMFVRNANEWAATLFGAGNTPGSRASWPGIGATGTKGALFGGGSDYPLQPRLLWEKSTGHFEPGADAAQDFGLPSKRWRTIRASEFYADNGARIAQTTTYDPTVTHGTNVSAHTDRTLNYERNGAKVTVWGRITVTADAAVASIVEISLPVASAFDGTADVGGAGATAGGVAVAVLANVADNRIRFSFTANADMVGSSRDINFTCSYVIK
jgi:hypothetical protein